MPVPRSNTRSGIAPPSYQSVLQNERGRGRHGSPTEQGYRFLQDENQPLLDEEGWQIPDPQADIPPGGSKRRSGGCVNLFLILIVAFQSAYIYANNSQWKEGNRRQEMKEREEQRRMIQWGRLQKYEECVSYGVARYQAPLEYVPPLWDERAACLETPYHIHRKGIFPTECHRINGTEIGTWVIDFDEPACKPWWRDIKDHGCTSRGSGIHRYEGHLEGYLEPDEFKANWAEMCSTTPHSMLGETYDSPTHCKYWPEIGVYGYWEIPDGQCS